MCRLICNVELGWHLSFTTRGPTTYCILSDAWFWYECWNCRRWGDQAPGEIREAVPRQSPLHPQEKPSSDTGTSNMRWNLWGQKAPSFPPFASHRFLNVWRVGLMWSGSTTVHFKIHFWASHSLTNSALRKIQPCYIRSWLVQIQVHQIWAMQSTFNPFTHWAMKKGPWVVRGFVGDEVLHSYMGFFVNKPWKGSVWNNQYYMESIQAFSVAADFRGSTVHFLSLGCKDGTPLSILRFFILLNFDDVPSQPFPMHFKPIFSFFWTRAPKGFSTMSLL